MTEKLIEKTPLIESGVENLPSCWRQGIVVVTCDDVEGIARLHSYSQVLCAWVARMMSACSEKRADYFGNGRQAMAHASCLVMSSKSLIHTT
jgi:hypothetical protein